MCGLVGTYHDRPSDPKEMHQLAARMASTIVHRGPDDEGTWADESGRVAFGFRRLSILDLSAAGHQPMRSASGRYTVVFNGELYNHLELRRELASGTPFRGHSDTETLLAGFDRWGVAATVDRIAGMFAIAVWDAERRTLALARDRFGKKPLYVYRAPGVLAFASELRAFRQLPGCSLTVDPVGVANYLRYLYVPAPRSVFREVRKLPAGHLLTLTSPGDTDLDGVPFWSVARTAAAARSDPLRGSDADAVDALESLLGDAVSQRLLSDVPVGALLSGGVDSSLVVGLMAERSAGAVRTYAVSFPDSGFDESAHASAVAGHFGTTHTTFPLAQGDLLGVVPRLPDIFDEPHADPSCVPTYLISALTRRDVTVALTGDGGDELFGGYNRYTRGGPLIRGAHLLPFGLRRRMFANAGGGALHALVQRLGGGGPQQSGRSRGRRLRRLMAAPTIAAMYDQLITTRADVSDLVPSGGGAPLAALAALEDRTRPLAERMMLFDQSVYLADDLLSKLDRASMAASLEARAPLLDHRIAALAWRLPLRLKVRGRTSKWILRELLARRLPPEKFERPKMGFSSPIDSWLRGPLRPWADDLLRDDGVEGSVLDATAVRETWAAFLTGGDDEAPLVWALAVYRAWERRWLGPAPVSG
ncbi:MAG: asparagine synthase (glutamine-hydrolyzing) [Gemmatimonadales bacterium]|nr:asparagine synthase (glutamine-hydrolyzing) [Gemmatimonadales bacterium]